MVPTPTGTASCIYFPRLRTVRSASAKLMVPEATCAEYSPRLWPATKLGLGMRHSRTLKAATDVVCLAMSYKEFIEAIEDHPDRAAAFMKVLVRRLRLMNEMMESVGPDRRGLRGMIRDWRKSVASSDIVCDAADLWKMLW